MTSSNTVDQGHAPVASAVPEAALAFQRLAPLAPGYATQPILEGFNWADCLAGIATGQWYLVVFRSVRRAMADDAALIRLDERAHAEALAASGLLFYFKGHLDAQRRCLSFCLWEDMQQARAAARLPLHQEAARVVAQMYESYELERYILTKADGRLSLVARS